MENFKKIIPNLITSIRIVGAIAILFLKLFSIEFFIVYGICGFTDAIDGYVARKLHVESKFGSLLDSISDLLFYTSLAIVLLPKLLTFYGLIDWLVIGIPVFLQIVGYILCAYKFNKFSALHTYANKLLGALIFAYPFFFIGDVKEVYTIYMYIGGVFALYAGLEVDLIHIMSKKYNDQIKSIFLLKKYNKIEG